MSRIYVQTFGFKYLGAAGSRAERGFDLRGSRGLGLRVQGRKVYGLEFRAATGFPGVEGRIARGMQEPQKGVGAKGLGLRGLGFRGLAFRGLGLVKITIPSCATVGLRFQGVMVSILT